MKQILLTLLISFGLTIGANAQRYDARDTTQNMSSKKIKKMDRKHTRHKAKKRHFKTQKDFQHRSRHNNSRNFKSYTSYTNGHNYNRETDRYRHDYRKNRQRGFTQWKRGWTLAYRYDRASFYDNQGYYYGYFNHEGYYFEEVFYRYDRHYTYKDRIRGRGLFDHRYYMPENSRYYGFDSNRY